VPNRRGDRAQAGQLCRFVLLLSLLPKQLIKVSHALSRTHLTQRGFVAEVLQLWIVRGSADRRQFGRPTIPPVDEFGREQTHDGE
jgi:hypothetical protein